MNIYLTRVITDDIIFLRSDRNTLKIIIKV